MEQCSLSNFTISSGHNIQIPSFLIQAYTIINENAKIEGLFRISGSIQKQKLLAARIEKSGYFGVHDHIHDVTALVKKFFRDLPVMILGDKEMQTTLSNCLKTGIYASRCIRLALLMLPPLHLYTLVSFLQLLKRLTQFESANKMNAYAFAVVVTPILMPVKEKSEANKIKSFVQIIQLLIEDATKVGIIPQRTLVRYCLMRKKSRYFSVFHIVILFQHFKKFFIGPSETCLTKTKQLFCICF